MPTLAVLVLAGPAQAESLRLPVTRDTWVSEVGREADGNNGGSARLKLKSYQEMSLVDVDASPLKGRVVAKATLHVKIAGNEILRRVTVGSVSSPWFEGRSNSYGVEKGASTFRSSRHGEAAWTPDGGDLCRVILGQGGSAWGMAEATPPDPQGWQTVAVDPKVMALRTAGLSDGFVLFDDTGSEWTRDGEKFTPRHMPNRYVYSRDQNAASAPYFTVELGPEDRLPPAAPAKLTSDTADLPAGELLLKWPTPADQGPAGVAGFLVTVDGRPVPRSLVPLAGPAGQEVTSRLRDLGLPAGKSVAVTVRAVDAAGNVGPEVRGAFRTGSRLPATLPGVAPKPQTPADAPLPSLSGMAVAVIDELDKVDPASGELIPAAPRGYLNANHLWNAGARRVSLHSARNEFVAFQVLIQGKTPDVSAALEFDGPARSKVSAAVGRYRTVLSKRGPLPDPIVPLGGPEDRGADPKAARQSLHVEVYVPHDAPPGTHQGTLTLSSGGERLSLPVLLAVWNFVLPDYLSFIPEMNCYGLPENERDYYRLAHLHRTVLDRVPYSQRGEVTPGCAPRWDGRTFDWAEWDRRFGPILSGAAFADLPRKGVPVDEFYLPLHENWPTPVGPNYDGGYWADEALSAPYRRAFVEASSRFAAHLNEKGWNDTFFLGFLNNKVDFKRNGWSRGSSPWLLDEPAGFQDFWALRYFAAAFHEGVAKAPGKAKLAFRADVSRPQWQRDSLDGLLDYNIVGGAMRTYQRIVSDRKRAEGQVVLEYGSTNAVEESNVQPLAWSVDVWSLGCDGVVPWQTVGRGDSWGQADTLSLFYPALNGRLPVPSVRLKAYRRGQQDVEYLTLLSQVKGEPRWALGQKVREELGLSGRRGASGMQAVEDAGTVRYGAVRPEKFWELRMRVGEAISKAAPPDRRRLVELRTPPRDPSKLSPRLVTQGTERGRPR